MNEIKEKFWFDFEIQTMNQIRHQVTDRFSVKAWNQQVAHTMSTQVGALIGAQIETQLWFHCNLPR